MSDDLDAILRRVASGELSPEQAHRLLGGTPSGQASAADHGTSDAGSDEPVTSIRLKTSYRKVELLADPSVAQVHVVGKHSVRHEGSALVITTAGPLDDDEQASDESTRPGAGRFSFSDLPRTIAWARSWRDHQLTVRVNPALPLELDVTGADIRITGGEAGLNAHLVASSLKADGLHGPLEVSALSSSVKLSAIPTGSSRVYCESSSVRLSLPTGADVKITATNRMGRVALPDRPVSTLPFEAGSTEVTIGEGHHQLALEAVMSSVTVNAQAWGWVPS
jgi:hypothetical protein